MAQINVRINERCNLRCRHCFEGQRVTQDGIMSLTQFKKVAAYYREHGGFSDMTILGGEPSLHPDLLPILEYATLTYKNVNLDTNGQFHPSVIDSGIDTFRRLKHLTISLQGSNALSHEMISGRGTFKKAVHLASYAAKSVVRVNFNYTLMTHNSSEADIREIMELARKISATIKFRKFIRIGSGQRISHLYLSNVELGKRCAMIRNIAQELGVTVRTPPVNTLKQYFCSLSTKSSIYINHEGFINYCPILTEILPDGSRIYSARFDYEKGKIIDSLSCNKESEGYRFSENSPSGCSADDFLNPEETRSPWYGIIFPNCCADPMYDRNLQKHSVSAVQNAEKKVVDYPRQQLQNTF